LISFVEDFNIHDTYAALNTSALWSETACPTKLNKNKKIKWAVTIPIYIIISENSFDTVNALSYKNILYYYKYIIYIYNVRIFNYNNWIKCKKLIIRNVKNVIRTKVHYLLEKDCNLKTLRWLSLKGNTICS